MHLGRLRGISFSTVEHSGNQSGPLVALADHLPGSEPLLIDSANPVNYHQAITDPQTMQRQPIYGLLALPDGDGPHPVVIIVPGSSGVVANHARHAVTLRDAGHGVCVIDPFTTRAVTSTVANQAQYPFAASAHDVLAALGHLSRDRRIDVSRISAQGHSRGGAAVLMAAMRVLADPLVGDLSLAGVYAVYPWCGQQFLEPRIGDTMVRIIIGERDEWCSAQSAQAQERAIALAGGSVSIRVVPGAHHSFDRHEKVNLVAAASVSPGAPIEYIARDGSMIDPTTGVPDPQRRDIDQFRAAIASGHGRKGALLGSEPGLAELFDRDMLDFHRGIFSAGAAVTPRHVGRAGGI